MLFRSLAAYQSQRLVQRFRRLVDAAPDDALRRAIARGYHKLLTYKDEYEVARLLSDTADKARAAFEGDLRLTYHLAPPGLTRTGPDGRPRKRAFGPWLPALLKPLSRLKVLRGTWADPFAHTAERRMERRLIREYERDIADALAALRPDTREAVRELAELPLQIRGFGPVKAESARRAEARRRALRDRIHAQPAPDRLAAE